MHFEEPNIGKDLNEILISGILVLFILK